MSRVPSRTSPTPESWRCDAGGDSVATLDIPGLSERARLFDVDTSLLVDVPPACGNAWLELAVEFDGRRLWCRRIPAHNPGQTDGLDHHHRVRLEVDQALRVRALVRVYGVRIRQLLLLQAREELN